MKSQTESQRKYKRVNLELRDNSLKTCTENVFLFPSLHSSSAALCSYLVYIFYFGRLYLYLGMSLSHWTQFGIVDMHSMNTCRVAVMSNQSDDGDIKMNMMQYCSYNLGL